MYLIYVIIIGVIVILLWKLRKANLQRRLRKEIEEDNLNYYSVLDTKPTDIDKVGFKRYTGVVLHTLRNTLTTGLSSNTITTIEREIFLKLENGDEFSTKIGGDDILIREGNRISLIRINSDKKKYLWIYFFNHDTKEEMYFSPYSVVRNLTKKAYVRHNYYTRFGTYGEQYEPEFLGDFERLKKRIRLEMAQA